MSLPVRTVHVLGMAVLVGGAALAWSLTGRRDDDPAAVDVAWRYERSFWPAVGVVVLTGVGNVGAMAPAVPDAGTAWGLAFSVKLGGVVVLLVGSVLRTALAWTCRDSRQDRSGSDGAPLLRAAYAATTLWLVGVVVLAEVIAHG